MKTKIPVIDRLRYAFDNTMSKGTTALIGWLAVLSLVIVILAAALISAARISQEDGTLLTFWEAAWASLMRTLDAGTMGGDTGWVFRIVMFAVTLGGVFIISTLIGVLSAGIEGKLDELRRGRSKVIETDHTIILGWNSQVFTIIPELVEANRSRKDACIMILGDFDKVEMETEISERVGRTANTRIVCRRGSPVEMADLEIVSLDTARAIIVLSPDEDDPDSSVIKTLLAITRRPGRRAAAYHIVAEMRDARNSEVARMVGGDEVEFVLVSDLVARIIAQTCRQTGLSVIYTDLLDFGGDEIYYTSEPALTGKTFGEALMAYEDCMIIGLEQTDTGVRLNPPMDTLISSSDRFVVIAEDDSAIRFTGLSNAAIDSSAIVAPVPDVAGPEKTLILGWNWRGVSIIRELDNYVAPGSEVLVVADHAGAKDDVAGCCPDLPRQTVRFQFGDTTDRRTLDGLDMVGFNHIILLCYSDTLSPQQADSRTLVTLLHLRDIASRIGRSFSITSEMLDVRNRNLAEAARADDFIVSDRLVSLILAQVAENKHLNAVFTDMFDPEGSEIYLKSAECYVTTRRLVNFATVIEAARRRGEIAMGYRILAESDSAAQSYGVVLNPEKSHTVSFSPGDRLIVLAE